MKKNFRILLILIAAAAVLLSVATVIYAEDVPDFTVTDKDGNERVTLSGSGEEALRAALAEICDGDTVKLNRNLDISNVIRINSTEDAPRVINFDLGGHLLYSLKKITAFSAGDYTTFNIYSSAPKGGIYITNKDNLSLGGNIFNIIGQSAVINAGEVTVGEVTYPGENLSTFSSCLIDLYPIAEGNKACDANSFFNLTGGNHYSICSDYSGFIIPRCGEATFNIKNANIITFETRAPINSEGIDTHLYMENCVLMNNEGRAVSLFNNAVGEVTIKDCVTTYSIYASNGSRGGVLTLLGNNIFSENVNGFHKNLIKDGEGLVLARTRSEYELIGGGRDIVYYDKTGSFTELREQLPDLTGTFAVVNADETVNCKFIGTEKNQQKTEIWCKGVSPEFPFDLPRGGVEGFYKYGWQKTVEDNGTVVYRAGLVGDFDVGVSVVYDKHVNLNIYIPAFLVDEGYLDFNSVMIGDSDFPMDDWMPKTVDGKDYYYAYTFYLDESDQLYDDIQIVLPCYFENSQRAVSAFIISLPEYVERVLQTEADGIYTEDEYALVHSVRDELLGQNG